MLRKIVLSLTGVFAAILSYAYSPAIRQIKLDVELMEDGSAKVQEFWDVCVASGTEWYLVRDNLADIVIDDLQVSDETGLVFNNIGEWDVDRSLEWKKGKCGIVHKKRGVELCWGVGSMGDHQFKVSYTMTNVVKSLTDYDMLHIQFVSPGLSSPPQKVELRLWSKGRSFDTQHCRAWGFGYVGSCEFVDGTVLFRSSERFKSNSSLIALLRFDKGMFQPLSTQNRDFQTVLDRALEGSDGSDEDDISLLGLLLMFIAFIAVLVLICLIAYRAYIRSILGCGEKEVNWHREPPFNSDLVVSNYTLKLLGKNTKGSTLALAMILRMIYQGYLEVSKDAKGRIEISFDESTGLPEEKVAAGLYDMMLKASGKDKVLQEKEFSSWSSSHGKQVSAWLSLSENEAKGTLVRENLQRGMKFTAKGQEEARNLLGFKKFLSDFTLMKEKDTQEAVLWEEYLVFGALFGIADKVAKQLKDINPELFEQVVDFDYDTFTVLILRSNMLSRAILNSSANYAASQAGQGFGGRSSFGGGGFGGGSR
ncbi:MAG: DUF2207 family protein [Candidatus Cryptobacteroides sp.]